MPTSSKDAFINNGGKAAIYSPGATARTLTLGAAPGDSGGVVVDGTYGGSLSVSAACGANTNDPAYIGVGIYVGYGGSGNLSILHGATVASGYGYIGLLPSDGTHKASNGAVTVDGAGSAWTLSGCPDARLFVSGNNTSSPGGNALLRVTSAGTINITNHTQALVSLSVGMSGTLTGNGTITVIGDSYLSRLVAAKGTLAPTGSLAIVGNLALTSSNMMLCNVTPQTADVVGVKAAGNPAGTAALDGRLSVTMTGTFTPSLTRYTLLEADGGLSGTFQQGISINYPPGQNFTPQITYDSTHVYLDLVFNN